jgi:calcineurin-like phosphoesterase family protein
MSAYTFSDPHFWHENMAKRRNFSCAEEMNELIVKNWNNTISKRDAVYLLSDITMEKSNYEILSRLNGIINVVLGNHDQRQHVREMLKYVNSVAGMIDYKDKVILTHCPIHPSQLEFKYTYNIHGHVHSNSVLKNPMLADYLGEKDPKYINVCAEVLNYHPVRIDTLIPWLL